MTTQTQNSGSRIKSLIAASQTDRFQWMEAPEDQQKKQLLNYLVSLIERYRQIEFIDRYSNAGYENTDQAVYNLLGTTDWESSVIEYRMTAQSLLKMLATPDVSKALGKNEWILGKLVEMTDLLIDFFLELDTPAFKTLFLMKTLLGYGSDSTIEKIQDMIEEYEARVEVVTSGKIKSSL